MAFCWNDEGDMLPNGFFRGIPKYSFRTLVPTRDDAVKALADNGIIGGRYNSGQQTRYFFCLLRLAHILWRRPDHLKVVVEYWVKCSIRPQSMLATRPEVPNTVNTVSNSGRQGSCLNIPHNIGHKSALHSFPRSATVTGHL